MNQQTVQSIYYTNVTVADDVTQRKGLTKQLAYEISKRIMDFCFASLGLLLAAPMMVLVMLAIKLNSVGPIFYTQTRVGKAGIFFEVIKFRTMVIDAEKNGPRWAAKNDSRVTRVGRFLRKTRIDEVPQLWNVIKGEMSLVGPRPERPNFTVQFNQEVPGFMQRLQVKPGVTGLAQVNGGYDLTPAEKLELDRQYIEQQGFWYDMRVLGRTVIVVLTGHGAR